MKPNQLEIRVDPVDGHIWAVRVPYNKPMVKIKDVTNDVLWCLCADLSAVNGTKHIERFVKFSDGMHCKITAEMVDD